MRLVPGDPALALPGTEADDAALLTLRRALALDRPMSTQFFAWLSQVLVGNFGRSISSGQPVLPMLMGALGPTAILATAAMLMAILIGVPCGAFAATHRMTARASVLTPLVLIGLSMPGFWVGLLLILAFAVRLPVFPASGYVSPIDSVTGHLAHLALPALTLGVAITSSTMRITRTAMLQALRGPHVRTAVAKRLSVRRAVWKHGFPIARATILIQLAVQTGKFLGGVVVIETVFSWPGIGKLAVDAVFARDFPVIQEVVLLAAVICVVINLAADLCHAMLDPQVTAR